MPNAFPYPAEVERAMQTLYGSLREHDRRRYAATEVAKLERGGTDYIATLLGCDPTTIRDGQRDLEQLQLLAPEERPPSDRIRRPGGGRKKKSKNFRA